MGYTRITMNILVFDIETVPDVESGRRLYQLEHESDQVIADIMRQKRLEKGHSDFLPHHLQRVVAISAALRTPDAFKIASLGNVHSNEKNLIDAFFKCLEKYLPSLVSWNGSGFDLPVLHYRALLHGISSPSYWNTGEQGDTRFRWNNYLNRYHTRHTDLMDILAAYQGRANAPLTEIAVMLGFPGKLGMDGAQVWETFLEGHPDRIRHYCETDVLNTYLIYLRFELMRGNLTESDYEQECDKVRQTLIQENKPHFSEFLNAWSH